MVNKPALAGFYLSRILIRVNPYLAPKLYHEFWGRVKHFRKNPAGCRGSAPKPESFLFAFAAAAGIRMIRIQRSKLRKVCKAGKPHKLRKARKLVKLGKPLKPLPPTPAAPVHNQQVQIQWGRLRQWESNTKFSESAGANIIVQNQQPSQVQNSECGLLRASGKTTEISQVPRAKIIKWKTNVCQV